MQPLSFLVPLGWIESVGPIIPLAILTLAIANMGTRLLSHRHHKQQAVDGDADSLDRYTPHVFTTTGIVILALLFTLYKPISGMILMIPVIGLFITDFFEFESREVEARNDMEFEQPKAALGVSVLLLIYAAYYGLPFLYEPYLDMLFA
jgi:hypothetical protein